MEVGCRLDLGYITDYTNYKLGVIPQERLETEIVVK